MTLTHGWTALITAAALSTTGVCSGFIVGRAPLKRWIHFPIVSIVMMIVSYLLILILARLVLPSMQLNEPLWFNLCAAAMFFGSGFMGVSVMLRSINPPTTNAAPSSKPPPHDSDPTREKPTASLSQACP